MLTSATATFPVVEAKANEWRPDLIPEFVRRVRCNRA